MSGEYPWASGDFVNRRTLNEKAFPPGGIILWSGATDTIPLGWALCDGQNGTPDLRGRFVVGSGGSYSVGATGGEDKHVLTAAEMPSHVHAVNATASSAGDHTHAINTIYGGQEVGYIARASSYSPSVSKVNTDASGAHTHTINCSVSASGGGTAHENRPPYYALCYIMRL